MELFKRLNVFVPVLAFVQRKYIYPGPNDKRKLRILPHRSLSREEFGKGIGALAILITCDPIAVLHFVSETDETVIIFSLHGHVNIVIPRNKTLVPNGSDQGPTPRKILNSIFGTKSIKSLEYAE